MQKKGDDGAVEEWHPNSTDGEMVIQYSLFRRTMAFLFGVALMCVTIGCWSAMAVAIQSVIIPPSTSRYFTGFLLTVWRLYASNVFFLVVAAIQSPLQWKPHHGKSLRNKRMIGIWVLYTIAVFGSAGFYAISLTLTLLPIGMATSASHPLMLVVWRLVNRKKVTLFEFIGTIIGFSGVVLIIVFGHEEDDKAAGRSTLDIYIGAFVGIMSAVCSAACGIIAAYMCDVVPRSMQGLITQAMGLVIVGVPMLPFVKYSDPLDPWEGIFGCLSEEWRIPYIFIGPLGAGVAWFCHMTAYDFLPVTLISVLSCFEVLFAIVGAIVFDIVSDPPAAVWGGAVLLLVGTVGVAIFTAERAAESITKRLPAPKDTDSEEKALLR